MAITGNNHINFVSELIYGDLGIAELSNTLPAGTNNHIQWTRDNIPNSGASTVTGDEFLTHHLDYMLSQYQAWRSKYFLAPVRPWDGAAPMDSDQSAIVPGSAVLPATTNALGDELRNYYNTTYRGGIAPELDDELKAVYSTRYWAFMKWADDLRKRVLGQPVIHVHKVFDRNGTVMSELDFTDIINPVHHVWHPNKPVGTGWVTPTPFFKTAAGQHLGKKEISRTQVGSEFFTFHRDHLEIFDRWLERSGLERMQSINTCAHDTDPNDPVPAGVEADSPGGYPHIEDWSSNPPDVIFNDIHITYWESDLSEFSNLGEMGQLFATDFNQFMPTISILGVSDTGYHGRGHGLNGDLAPASHNNHSYRFFAWHGHNDGIWEKREHLFDNFSLVQPDESDFPEPAVMTIVREFGPDTDTVENAAAINNIDISTGQGTIKVKVEVQPDEFDREIELKLSCDILRETGGLAPMISIERDLVIIPNGAPGANERLQGTVFFEEFEFDGSAGTEDGDGHGPFRSDNLAFAPTAVGFKNSRIKISGYLTCKAMSDGTIPIVTGTLSSSGITVTGSGTAAFTTELREGDLIRSNGEVREIATITNDTTLTLLEAFAPDLPAGTSYERLDGFDHESVLELPLVQEKQPPHITGYLDRSSFSIEQVAAAGTTVFDNAFYVVLQDKTERALSITWPAEVDPGLYGLIAPTIPAAGLFYDLPHAPVIELRDEITNALIPDVLVECMGPQPENPSLHPSIPQRVTYPCQITFTNQGAFAGLSIAGDEKDLKLAITATDRSGNQITDDSLRVRLQINPNPFMLDGPTHWLSTDTRVFQIEQGAARFGVAAGWTDPNNFIQDVIQNFRDGSGTAGGELFDDLEDEQGAAKLEYSQSINGTNIYNFALAQVRLQSDTVLNDLRANFRFFRWGTANVAFDDSLAYRSGASGISKLGKTTTDELATIPFFANLRNSINEDMETQTDPKNVLPTFGPTGGSEEKSYFGAYLDINQPDLRFPNTFVDDGPFNTGTNYSIRDLLEDHHQCMVVELFHSGDLTEPSSTPGTSDNLAQRNLLIVQTANPGTEITRTVQHGFNIDLTRNLKRPARPSKPDAIDTHGHHHGDIETHHDGEEPESAASETEKGRQHIILKNSPTRIGILPVQTPDLHLHHELMHEMKHLEEGWHQQFPKQLEFLKTELAEKFETKDRWTFDVDHWKPTTGLDELVFFWNNIPANAEVELFLPAGNVEEIINFRQLRHAPDTVKIIDSQTLRLFPTGTTFLPISPFHGDNLSGMITVKLPAGIKKGQIYKVDVVQMRADEARTLGGFQLNIQVEKAIEIWDAEIRTLELFHKRLSVKPKNDRWYPVTARQVQFARDRAKGFIDLANETHPDMEPIVWNDPTETQKGQKIRIVLEKIQISDDCEPFFKGKGEFRFGTKVWTRNNSGVVMEKYFPEKGVFKLSDKAGRNEVVIEAEIFNGWVEDELLIKASGIEFDTFDPDDHLPPYVRAFKNNPVDWYGQYGPTSELIDPQDLGVWKIWYRIEAAG